MVKYLCLVPLGTACYKAFNNIMEKVVSALTSLKKYDYDNISPLLEWLPLDVVKCTFECTI